MNTVTQTREEQKRENKLRRIRETAEFAAKLEPGTVLVNSWGYDQTNIDFYEVVSKTKASVKIRPIGSEEVEDSRLAMQGTCRPVRGQYTGDTQTRRIGPGYVKVGHYDFQTATIADRDSYRYSTYA
tara:strand:- start:5450 stop:5830 length:381 start_codon:yes stop_codon:yes gene_type:complete